MCDGFVQSGFSLSTNTNRIVSPHCEIKRSLCRYSALVWEMHFLQSVFTLWKTLGSFPWCLSPLFLPSFTPLTSFSSSSLPPLLFHHSFSYLLSSFLSIPDVSVINRFKKGFSVSTVLYFLSGKLVPVSEAGNGPSPVWVCFGDSGEHCCC